MIGEGDSGVYVKRATGGLVRAEIGASERSIVERRDLGIREKRSRVVVEFCSTIGPAGSFALIIWRRMLVGMSTTIDTVDDPGMNFF